MRKAFLTLLAVLAFHAFGAPSPGLGDGYPGRVEACPATPALQGQLDAFSLKAGWFRRDDPPPDQYFNPVLCPVNELPFLLYRSPART